VKYKSNYVYLTLISPSTVPEVDLIRAFESSEAVIGR
jgi:hypothetical protein